MKHFFIIITLIVCYFIISINVKLHTLHPKTDGIEENIMLQLNFLESAIKENNQANNMQTIFPEGNVFANVLYGLTWCELAINSSKPDSHLKQKALNEALYAYKKLKEPDAIWPFDPSLKPPNGIFYTGWRNYLLSKIFLVDPNFDTTGEYKSEFENQCLSIARAIEDENPPFPESYRFNTWPADMFVAAASLSNYNKAHKNDFESDLSKWLLKVKQNLDANTGLVPHKVSSKTVEALEGARGCSMALILRMLSEINMDFGNEQFTLFDSLFIDKTFGLPSVREYPKGARGLGDVDSGPVIFGVGFTATIVMAGTLPLYGYPSKGTNQYTTITAFGLFRKTKNESSYLMGKLPMADLFIAWGQASCLAKHFNPGKEPGINWRIKFHLISIGIISLLILIIFRKKMLSLLK